jgi:hypothetical protein
MMNHAVIGIHLVGARKINVARALNVREMHLDFNLAQTD